MAIGASRSHMNHLINDKPELDLCARETLAMLTLCGTDKPHGALVLGLTGELGAGKTAFVQSLAKELGVVDRVTSPTFVIARFYDIPAHEYFRCLVHVDAYRIEDEGELRPLGWNELLADSRNLVVVEWPEQLGKSFPDYAYRLYFAVIDETTRRICDKK